MPRPRTNYPPLSDLLAAHSRHQRRRGLDDWTIRQRRYKVQRLAAHYPGRHVLTLTTDHIEDWLDSLGVSAKTRVTYISELRTFYTWAAEVERLIPRSPAAGLARPRTRRNLPRPILDVDLADALAGADDRLLAILSLMAYEGLRCVEVSRLRGEDIDRRAMVLRVERGKGNKTRNIPLHPECLAALERHGLPDRGPVFVARGGVGKGKRPIIPATVSQLVNRHLPGAWTAHQLRHWFGTAFYRESRDLLLTQEVMGHDRPETTSVYAKADTARAAAVVAALQVGGSTSSHAPDNGPAGGEGWGPAAVQPETRAR